MGFLMQVTQSLFSTITATVTGTQDLGLRNLTSTVLSRDLKGSKHVLSALQLPTSDLEIGMTGVDIHLNLVRIVIRHRVSHFVCTRRKEHLIFVRKSSRRSMEMIG